MKKVFEKIYRPALHLYGRASILKHGFWFVDIPRTSSTSIRSELGQQFGRAYGKRDVIELEHRTNQIFSNHMTARQMKDFLGDTVWRQIFTFSVVRNPWDRVFSMYLYRKKMNDECVKEWSFREYVLALSEATPETEGFKLPACRFGASDYVLGEDGEIIVDFIAKYENRSEDLKLISSRLKLDKFGENHVQRAKPKTAHYSDFYDSEMKNIIRQLYSKDIELFGYRFEEQAHQITSVNS